MTKTAIELTASVYLNYTLEKMMETTNMSEQQIIRFLSENIKEPKVKEFLIDYYNRYAVKDTKAIIISDTHLGGENGHFELLDSVYNFALKNNIKYIIHVGDIIEGNVNPYAKSSDLSKQLKMVVNNYPQTNEIKTLYLIGNHDFPNGNQVKNAMEQIKNTMYIGDLKSYIILNNKHRILVHHSDQYGIRIPELDYNLRLQGHSHNFYFMPKQRQIGLPPLCSTQGNNFNSTGFIVLLVTEKEYVFGRYNFKNNKPKLQNGYSLTLKR